MNLNTIYKHVREIAGETAWILEVITPKCSPCRMSALRIRSRGSSPYGGTSPRGRGNGRSP
jgi:hypothetical protein